MGDDENDLTDRYDEICGELEGKTLEDEWEENPNPPDEYGTPDPRTVIEEVAGCYWYWHSKNPDAQMKFDGDAVEIKR